MAPLTTLLAIFAVLAADMLLTTQPAQAQQGFGNFYSYQAPRPRRAAKKKRVEQPEAAQADTAKPDSKNATGKTAEKSSLTQPVSIIVSLANQHASIYDANGFVTRTRVSTGQAGHRTPSGVFSVIGKKRYHRSNIYSGAPMPFMQRITWSGIALHAGVVPGYPASHGCIRLPAGFAPQLYKMTEMGARVVVTPTDVKPVEFSHPLLPLPKMHEAPAIAASPDQQTAKASSVELASMDTAAVSDSTAASAPETPKLLNPIAYAKALKQRAQAEKTAADAAAKAALVAAQSVGAEARQTLDAVRKAQAGLSAAQAKLATAAAATPTGTITEDMLAQEKSAAEAAVKQAEAALSQAEADEAAKSSAAFDAVETYKQATAAADAAEKLSEEADRRREQVSVFVSRKEGRVFIRQGWKEVWEAPVTIRDPDRPLGTHVYSAVDASPDGSSIRWTAITMPPDSQASPARRARDKDKAPEAPVSTPETAAGALDRIELPEGARERMAELLWTGGSLIVSDQPRSPEMSENATDFIVLTR